MQIKFPFPAAGRGLAAVLIALLAPLATAQSPQRLPVETLSAGLHLIQAEIAQTPAQREIGLMNRSSMPAQAGMLFIFERPGTQCFWMKNTLLPLTIAFLRDDGSIVNTADMQPQSLQAHCSKEPVRLALEMNQGWFERKGMKPGDRLRGKPFAGAAAR